MDIKSLMIGDWVYDTLSQTNIKVHSGCFERNPLNGICYAENLVPIPLTKEILEKNGFEDIGDDTYQLEEKPYWFGVDFFNSQYGCEYDTSTHEYEDDEHRLKLYGIPSVHELQNAMRICGIEKEIEL